MGARDRRALVVQRDAVALGLADVAGVGVDLADDGAQERRLARAVAADQRQALARRQAERDAVVDDVGAVALAQPGDVEGRHARRVARHGLLPFGQGNVRRAPRCRPREELRRSRPIRPPRRGDTEPRRKTSDRIRRTRPFGGRARGDRGARVPRADADSGRDHPGDHARPRHHRPGADGQRQDGGLRAAGRRADRRDVRGHPGARADAHARALHPGCAGAAHVLGVQGREGRRVLRRPADPRADGAAAPGPADRGRHARPRDGPDPPRLAAALGLPATSCSTRPTRCSRSASWRTSSGSSRRRRRAVRRCSSRPRCRRRSASSPTATSTSPCT